MSAPKRRRRYGIDKDELPRSKKTEEPPFRNVEFNTKKKAKMKKGKGKSKSKLPMKKFGGGGYGALRNVRSA